MVYEHMEDGFTYDPHGIYQCNDPVHIHHNQVVGEGGHANLHNGNITAVLFVPKATAKEKQWGIQIGSIRKKLLCF